MNVDISSSSVPSYETAPEDYSALGAIWENPWEEDDD
jgi:hypothetical protein